MNVDEQHAEARKRLMGTPESPVGVPAKGVKPKLIIMAGLPGAGKTSYLKDEELQGRFDPKDYVSVNTDYFLERLPSYRKKILKDQDPDAANQEFGSAAQLKGMLLEDSLVSGRNILFDTTLAGRFRLFNKIIQNAKHRGYDVEVRYIPIDLDEAKRRVKVRFKRTCRNVPDQILEKDGPRLEENLKLVEELEKVGAVRFSTIPWNSRVLVDVPDCVPPPKNEIQNHFKEVDKIVDLVESKK